MKKEMNQNFLKKFYQNPDFKMNKKGAEMTISTIVVIVLALVVLVVLIMGFTSGWSSLWQKVIGFGGDNVNVQSVIQSCSLACTTEAEYDYCVRKRAVVFEEDSGLTNGNYHCKQLETILSNISGANLKCTEVSCSGQNPAGENTEENPAGNPPQPPTP